jgi:predicted ArsR family transcriptional regulator
VPDTHRDERFFASTRGKIALLLRGTPCTVEQLAQALDLTDNAVRAHLVALERDGLVREAGSVRTARRPSLTYELAPDAERLFPKAYGTVLSALLTVLDRELPQSVVDRMLRGAGRHLAHELAENGQNGDLAARSARAVAVFADLGGSATIEVAGDVAHVRGHGCPLAIVVREHSDVCALVEALLEVATGAHIQEQCERTGQPHCHFRLTASEPRASVQ